MASSVAKLCAKLEALGALQMSAEPMAAPLLSTEPDPLPTRKPMVLPQLILPDSLAGSSGPSLSSSNVSTPTTAAPSDTSEWVHDDAVSYYEEDDEEGGVIGKGKGKGEEEEEKEEEEEEEEEKEEEEEEEDEDEDKDEDEEMKTSDPSSRSESLPGSPTVQATVISDIKTPDSRPSSPQIQLANVQPDAKPVRPDSPFGQTRSHAAEEWADRKKRYNKTSETLDKLMQYQGLERVKQQFLDMEFKVELSKAQGLDMRAERFNIVFEGNPGTGKNV